MTMRVNPIFGFLGSGKTTLVRRILEERASIEPTAVIVNEFGDIGIDADIIAGDAVIASIDGTLVIMNLSDGKERWRYEISDEITSPAIVNGMILVGTDEGQVLAFGEKGRK